MDRITLTQQLDYGKFIQFKLLQYFLRPRIIFLYLVIALIVSMRAWINSGSNEVRNFSILTFLIFFVILLPLIIYLSVRRMYKTNKMIQDEITYMFTDDEVVMKGSLFETRYKWDAIYMAEEYDNWLLIYTSMQTAIHLYKPNFRNQADISILKSIINSNDHIHSKFKS